jgi:glucose/arabinose dehydrogenase
VLALLLVAALFALTRPTGRPSVTPAQAQANIPWPQIALEPFIASGLTNPVHITHAGDLSGRMFVVERAGTIRLIKNGSLQATSFLDIHTRVLSSGSEQGLLSVAFPPGYSAKQYFYVYYTNLAGSLVISRFYTTNDPDFANAALEQMLLTIPHPGHSNHNGGQLAFGPDGYLYIGPGDGGGGGDPDRNAQNPASLLGKILRIEVEPSYTPSNAPFQLRLPYVLRNGSDQPVFPTYQIPKDNPFIGQPGYRPEIWALGLRNPWRFSFDRLTGDLYIGDVGQGAWEEIDFQPANSHGGENYGWNVLEGNVCYGAATCNRAGMTMPVFVYPHPITPCASVTGGSVYRGSGYPAMQGIYFLADFCTGQIWGLQTDGKDWFNQPMLNSAMAISTFGESEGGGLYLADYVAGAIYQVTVPNP